MCLINIAYNKVNSLLMAALLRDFNRLMLLKLSAVMHLIQKNFHSTHGTIVLMCSLPPKFANTQPEGPYPVR